MFKKNRLVSGMASVAGLAVLSVLAIATPAHASLAQCPNSRACGWVDSNYSGAFGAWASSTSSLTGFHDVISSMANNRTAYIGWWSDPAYAGNLFQEAPGDAGFFNWPDPRNDSFDSVFFY
jgi:hypothetical protein